MPPTFDDEDLAYIDEVVDSETRKTYAPPRKQKIRWYTVGFLILNRTIGSGIFVTSATIIQNTRSPGIALIFWSLGGLLSLCVALVWLEFGLTIPRKQVVGGTIQCVPRSGGEKNYVRCHWDSKIGVYLRFQARTLPEKAKVSGDVHVWNSLHPTWQPCWQFPCAWAICNAGSRLQ